MKKKTVRSSRRNRPFVREMLDRSLLTRETPNYRAGRADLEATDTDRLFLSGAAPRDFHVSLHVEGDRAWLWIGRHADPGNVDAARSCFAIIGGDALREIAAAVLGQGKRKRGAR